MAARRSLFEKRIKRALVEDLERKAENSLDKVIEWLWEDHGIRVGRSWDRVKKTIVSNKSITPQDLVVLMLSMGVEVDEELWFKERKRLYSDEQN